ncbi:MAG: hypothetical protein AAFV62_02130 [Pseudomonadota bacterium]
MAATIKALTQGLSAVGAAALLLFASSASATIFSYEDTARLGGARGIADRTIQYATTFDDQSERLSFSMTVDNSFVGGWWVVNDGPNPKRRKDELAIFYFDDSDVTSYVYNGRNSANSYRNPGIVIDTFSRVVNFTDNGNGTETYAFSIDASGINDFGATQGFSNWQGASFDESVGTWLHPFISNTFAINDDGSIDRFRIAGQGWYDTSNKKTEVHAASAPPALVLLVLALAGIGAVRLRGSAQLA